jgi:hypothetical protein
MILLLCCSRVTRCVFEKIAQSVAKAVIVGIITSLFPLKNVAQKILATSATVNKLPKVKKSPNSQKFGQSGHPVSCSLGAPTRLQSFTLKLAKTLTMNNQPKMWKTTGT